MKRICAFVLALTLVLCSSTATTGATNTTDTSEAGFNSAAAQFSDVPDSAYFAAAVRWAVERGITVGTGEDTFSPNALCTRAQIVTFLYRAAGSPVSDGSEPSRFADISPEAYYADAVQWAVEQDITVGTGEDTFSPNAPCTRGQIVTFLYRNAGAPAAADNADTFSDVVAGAYYAEAVCWAVAKGITKGTSTDTFSPSKPCTRAEAVTFLYRSAQSSELPDEPDSPGEPENPDVPDEPENPDATDTEEYTMQMKINDTPVSVQWEDNESVTALTALVQQTPLTIHMSMYGGFEQVGPIGQSLPRNDIQTMTTSGDIVLYSGNQIVVFYGSNSWAYTRLGLITDKTSSEMAELLGNGNISITIGWVKTA